MQMEQSEHPAKLSWTVHALVHELFSWMIHEQQMANEPGFMNFGKRHELVHELFSWIIHEGQFMNLMVHEPHGSWIIHDLVQEHFY